MVELHLAPLATANPPPPTEDLEWGLPRYQCVRIREQYTQGALSKHIRGDYGTLVSIEIKR